MTPVKDQGSCGSCWAFSAVETLESVARLEGGELLDLSEQELVDCSGYTGNGGCAGGWMYWAYDYVMDHDGLALEEEYPYHAKDEACSASAATDDWGHNDKVSTYYKVEATSDSLQGELNKHPVAVALDAGTWSFYQGGVLSECGSMPTHAVVAVGFEADNTWIVRNSWGQRWGESGYIRLAEGNTCNILSYAYVPKTN